MAPLGRRTVNAALIIFWQVYQYTLLPWLRCVSQVKHKGYLGLQQGKRKLESQNQAGWGLQTGWTGMDCDIPLETGEDSSKEPGRSA